jgi:hypothetical protein
MAVVVDPIVVDELVEEEVVDELVEEEVVDELVEEVVVFKGAVTQDPLQFPSHCDLLA